MALLFSAVTVTAGYDETEFTVGGIPKEYDVSGSSEKILFKSYANVIDESTIELVEPKGELFYTTPSSPVTIKKAD